MIQIITLCDECAAAYKSMQRSIIPYTMLRATTTLSNHCFHCDRKKPGMKMYRYSTPNKKK